MVVFMWILFALTLILAIAVFGKKNAANLKTKNKDGTTTQMPEKSRKRARASFFVISGFALFFALVVSAVNSGPEPYEYKVISIEPSDFMGRVRTGVRGLVSESATDPDRLKATMQAAAKTCGRKSDAYIVWLYDREIDAEGGATVGMAYVGDWSGDGSAIQKDAAEVKTAEERAFQRDLNDKARAEKAAQATN